MAVPGQKWGNPSVTGPRRNRAFWRMQMARLTCSHLHIWVSVLFSADDILSGLMGILGTLLDPLTKSSRHMKHNNHPV